MENYFNYFTEIEECFRRYRGSPALLSTLDWALIESWKEAGLPLEAVLAGIERTFERYQSRPRRLERINSLAYCSQEVLRAAQASHDTGAAGQEQSSGRLSPPAPPIAAEEVLKFLNQNAEALEKARERARQNGDRVLEDDLSAVASALRSISARQNGGALELRDLENDLTAIEDKLTPSLARASGVDLLAELRREVERGLAAYRGKMTAPQIESLERQFLKKRLYEHYRIPRLSLFYL